MVVEDDLFLGREREERMEDKREERGGGSQRHELWFLSLGTNFLTLDICSLRHPMKSTLKIPVPATSQSIGTDCILTAIIPRRHQNFIRTQKEWDFISEASYLDTMRLYSDCIPMTKKVSDCIPTVIMPGLYSDCNCPILNTVGILYQNSIVVCTIEHFLVLCKHF